MEPLWKGQESLTKVAKFGPFPCTILYKSCLFYPSLQATSFDRPPSLVPSLVAFIEGFNCISNSIFNSSISIPFPVLEFELSCNSNFGIELTQPYMQWLGTELVTSNYLNQWWPEFVAIWCHQASVSLRTFCACRSKETVKFRGFNLQCINLVVMACTKLETSRYRNQWSPEFCQYIESSGLSAGPVNQRDSPVLTVDILRPMLSTHTVWIISAYGVQWWIVDKNKFTNLRLNIC